MITNFRARLEGVMEGFIAKISVTSPIVFNMQTRELLAGETKSSFVLRFQHLNNKNNVCKEISLLLLFFFFS